MSGRDPTDARPDPLDNPGGQQYTSTLDKLHLLRKKEKEAKLRALPKETPAQIARHQLHALAEELHGLWPPQAVATGSLGNEQRTAALIEHAKCVSSGQAIVSGARPETYDEEQWLIAWQRRCDALHKLGHTVAEADSGSRYDGSWARLARSIDELPAKEVKGARDDPQCVAGLDPQASWRMLCLAAYPEVRGIDPHVCAAPSFVRWRSPRSGRRVCWWRQPWRPTRCRAPPRASAPPSSAASTCTRCGCCSTSAASASSKRCAFCLIAT